jgi:hypothetical protein
VNDNKVIKYKQWKLVGDKATDTICPHSEKVIHDCKPGLDIPPTDNREYYVRCYDCKDTK